MDAYDRTDLLLCTEGLGRLVAVEADDGSAPVPVYQLGPDSLGCLQDIQRFLRRDDLETKSFHLQLGSWNILSAHLLPMLTTHRESFDIVFEILKLLVMLTMSPDQKLRNPTAYKSRLAVYKEAFVNQDIVSIIVSTAAAPLSRVGMDRTHQDIQLLELVLTLFRNLLSIVPIKPNVTDEFIFTLDKEHVFDLILHLANQAEAPENARFNHLILEFFFLLLAPHDPRTLATTPDFDLEPALPIPNTGTLVKETNLLTSSGFSVPGSDAPSKPPSLQGHMSSRGAALAAALESSKSPARKVGAAGTRHSRFGGYVVSSPTIKANVQLASFVAPVSEEAAKRKKPIPNAEFSSNSTNRQSSLMSIVDVLNPKLQELRPSRGALSGAGAPSSSSSSSIPGAPSQPSSIVTKLLLKRLANRVLDYAFNELLLVIKGLVNSHSPLIVDADLNHFVWAIGFFPAFLTCEYQQLKLQKSQQPNSSLPSLSDDAIDFNISAVQAIFEEATFYYLLEQLERYETEKNAAKVAIHFLALKHLIFTLFGLFESGLEDHMRISESIIMKLIYNPELLVDRLPRLVRTFTKMKKGQAFILPHLIECVHLFLSVLERISEHGLKKLVQMKKRSKATFGSKLVGDEEERRAANAIRDADADFIDDTGDGNDSGSTADAKEKEQNDEDDPAVNADDDDDYSRKAKQLKELLVSLQEEDDDEDAAQNEKYFDVNDYITFYSKQSIINAIMELLRHYESNSDQTNEAVLGMLKRVESLGGLPMLFQVSHLRIIANMLIETPKTKLSEAALALKRFGRKLAGKFLDHFSNDPVTFGLTTLWPKKLSYARDLNEGFYLTYNSLYDGTLEDYEARHASRLLRDNYDSEDEATHSVNPSRVGSSYNQRARPYLGEGLQGNVDFDLADLLAQPSSSSSNAHTSKSHSRRGASLTKEERLDAHWKELRAKQPEWTESHTSQLKTLYSSYSVLDEADLVPLIVSMLDIEPSPSAAEVYLQLEKIVDPEAFSKILRPKLDIHDIEDDPLPERTSHIHRSSDVQEKKRSKSKSKSSSTSSRIDSAISAMDADKVVLDSEVNTEDSAKVRTTSKRSSEREKAKDDGESSESSSSDSEDRIGFVNQPGRGKTIRQINEEMQKRKQQLLALEEKRRAELAVLSEKRREERAEQKKLNEAAAQEEKEKRMQERLKEREAKLAQKEHERQAAQEAKALARQEKKEAKEKEKLEKRLERQKEREANGQSTRRSSIKRKPVRKVRNFSEDGSEEKDGTNDSDANTDSEKSQNEDEPVSVAKSRPKRAAASRKRQSAFDDYLDTLGLSEEEDDSNRGTSPRPTDSSEGVQKPASTYGQKNPDDKISAMDIDEVHGDAPTDHGETEAKIGESKPTNPKSGKGKRKRSSEDEEFTMEDAPPAAIDESEAYDSEDYEEDLPKKRSRTPKKSSKKAASKPPAKKKAKLTASTSQPDSAPLESSLFTTEEVEVDGRLSRTTTTITTGTTKRKLIRNDGGVSSVDQSFNHDEDDDDDDVIL